MGNICCDGYEEEYKHGAWQGGHGNDDDDDDEVSFANHFAVFFHPLIISLISVSHHCLDCISYHEHDTTIFLSHTFYIV